jgi:hypothetical protein
MLDPKSITTGSRKYSFYIDKGSFNLFQRCYTRGGRHDYVTGSRVAGPNAFVDCYATQTYADIGPHHRYATGILFDNVRGGETRVQNRKAMGSGHGWAGAQTMFWNCVSETSEFKVESPLGAMNWGIGCTGVVQSGAGFWESWRSSVTPRSLYYQQLQDRLGAVAVDAVTLPVQKKGTIWDALIRWAGYGDFAALLSDAEEKSSSPGSYALYDCYPNPFNPSTVIRYELKHDGLVRLSVYDLLGREIVVLVNEIQTAGTKSAVWNAQQQSAGTYFYRLRAAGRDGEQFSDVRKVVLLK